MIVVCQPCDTEMTPPLPNKNHYICSNCGIKFPIRLIYPDQIPNNPTFRAGRARHGTNWSIGEDGDKSSTVMIKKEVK